MSACPQAAQARPTACTFSMFIDHRDDVRSGMRPFDGFGYSQRRRDPVFGATGGPVSPGSQSEKVAILGGGPAAITAAFALTAPELENRFEVTVYLPGWRLGGKCASGRNMSLGERIEE